MRFIATADWQLGMTAHFLDADARPRYQQARFDVVRRIGQLAREVGAAFVVVAGDVFESNQLDRAVVARTFEALREYSVPVLLVPGNHDPLDAVSLYDSPAFAQAPPMVRVARGWQPIQIVPGVEVVPVPWQSKFPGQDLVAQACAHLTTPPANMARILVGHGAVSTLSPDQQAGDTIDVAQLQAALTGGLLDIAVLGDRHSTTEVCERIWYPGTPEVTRRTEVDPGNVLVIDIDPASGSVAVDKRHVGNWVFTVVEERLDAAADVAALAQRLDSIPDKATTAVWLKLVGSLTNSAAARLDAILQDAAALFALLEHWTRHEDLVVLPDDADFRGLGLAGFAHAAVEDLTQQAAELGPEAGVAQDALALLYRLTGAGR